VLGVMARFGAGGVYMGKTALEAIEQDKGTPVKNLKLGAKEMVGKREAQVVQYRLEDKDSKDSAVVSLWIDTKTHLPLKRLIVGEKTGKNDDIRITETYSVFTVDSKLDGKLFEIPQKQ